MDTNTAKKFTLLMALGTFVVVLDNTIMNVSIQALVADLNTTVSGIQAAIALNALMMAAFVLFGGKLADIIGMKKTFMTGVIIYIIGSLTASFSNNLTLFIFGWCLIQGIGAALMLPNVQTLIRAFLNGEARAKAYGMMAGVNAIAAAMGPIIGGFLTTYFSWRWAFRMEVAFLLVLVVFNRLIPKDGKLENKVKLDKMGVVLQAVAMIFFVLGLLLISDYGLLMAKQPFVINGNTIDPFGLGLSPAIWSMALGVIFFLLFMNAQNKNVEEGKPTLIHPALFKIKDFVNGLKVRSLQVSIVAGILFSIPLFMQVSFQISAFQTGIALLPLSISLTIGAIAGVKLAKKILPRSVIMWGSAIMTVGALILTVGVDTGTKPSDLFLGLTVLGFGLSMVGSQIVNIILSAVKPEETAEASGLTSTLEQVGNSMGVAILGTLLTVTLTMTMTHLVSSSPIIPADMKTEINAVVQNGIEIVSNAQIQEAAANYDPVISGEIINLYDQARTNAFRINMVFIALIGVMMFIMSLALPKKKLVEVDE